MSLSLLFLLVGCGLEDIDAKYRDTGGTEAVDPDPVGNDDESGGGAEDGGDETAGATTGGATTGGGTTGGATSGGATTGGATTGGTTSGGGSTTGGTDEGGSSGAGGTSGGEAAPCLETEVEDCSGDCASIDDFLRLADGICDTMSPNWNCGTYAYDGGDCEEATDPVDPGDPTGGGTTTDTGAAGVEYPAVPGGDCERFDGIGVYDCLAEECRPTGWLGDGYCDDIFAMDCEETGWDGGDCSPEGEDDGVCHDVEYAASVYAVDPSDSALYTHDFSPSCGIAFTANDVAYLWTPTETRNYCIRAKSVDEASEIAPVVSVWSEDCGTELYCEAGTASDAAPSATISAEFTEGATYVVAVEHSSAFDSGLFLVQIDECAPDSE